MSINSSKYKDIGFSSQFDYQREFLSGSVNYSVSSFGVQTHTIAHGLEYNPFFRLFVLYPNGRYYSPAYGAAGYEASLQVDSAYTDNNNLYVTVSENDGGGIISGTIYYKIYRRNV